jgi:hypothetical protein
MAKKSRPVENYFQAGLTILAKYGVSAVIALGVVYWMAVTQSSRLDRIADDLNAHKMSTAELVKHLEADTRQTDQLIAISSRICINTAKTDQDRLNCVVFK